MENFWKKTVNQILKFTLVLSMLAVMLPSSIMAYSSDKYTGDFRAKAPGTTSYTTYINVSVPCGGNTVSAGYVWNDSRQGWELVVSEGSQYVVYSNYAFVANADMSGVSWTYTSPSTGTGSFASKTSYTSVTSISSSSKYKTTIEYRDEENNLVASDTYSPTQYGTSTVTPNASLVPTGYTLVAGQSSTVTTGANSTTPNPVVFKVVKDAPVVVTYDLNFVNDEDSVTDSLGIEEQTAVVLPEPTKADESKFIGWLYEFTEDGQEYSKTLDAGYTFYMPNYDVTMTAQWEEKLVDTTWDFTIELITSEGNKTIEIKNNESHATPEITLDLVTDTYNDDKVFAGWTATSENAEAVRVTLGDGTKFYQWLSKEYITQLGITDGLASITYVDGATVKAESISEDVKVTLQENWLDDKNNDGIADEDQEFFTATFDPNGGAPSPSDIEYLVDGDRITLPSISKGNATLEGWSDGESTYEPGFEYTVIADTDFVAVWKDKTYTVTYLPGTVKVVENMPIDNTEYLINASVTVSNKIPTCTGYDFLGWDRNGTGIVEIPYFSIYGVNEKLTAQWKATEYKIEYKGINKIEPIVNPEIYTIEDEITLNNPTKSGYVFTGWESDYLNKKAVKVTIIKGTTGSLVFKAKWAKDINGNLIADKTEDTYTVTYTDGEDDENIFEDQTTTDILVDTPTPEFDGGTPVRDGYKFIGWDHDVTDLVEGSIVYTALWNKVNNNTSGSTWYDIYVNKSGEGYVSPNGGGDSVESVGELCDATFTIVPEVGYRVSAVWVDGYNVGAVYSYTFKEVLANHTIHVDFVKGVQAHTNPSTGAYVTK